MWFSASSRRRWLWLLVVATLYSAGVAMAQGPLPTPAKPKAALVHKPAKAGLSTRQKQGVDLLEIAQSEATGLQPDMGAFVLWQAARGYARIDSRKSAALLKEALRVTQTIERDEPTLKECAEPAFCGPRHWLQAKILQDLIAQSKQLSTIEEFLAGAEQEFRTLLCSELSRRYIEIKDFDRARELLDQVAEGSGYFPYQDAISLIQKLPPERSGDRVAIFSQALNSFTQHSDELYVMQDDLAIMVLRFWQELPASLVLEAIDQILDRARQADKPRQQVRVGVSAKQGDAYFGSQYEFRLFQLLPVLDQVDATRAESLRGESAEVQAALDRYPRGLNSMGAFSNGAGSSAILGIGALAGDNPQEQAAEQVSFEIERHQDQIRSEARKDPRKALSDAMGLPLTNPSDHDYSVRASTLQSVARIAASKNPSVSRAALQEARKIASSMPPRSQRRILADSLDIYLLVGEQEDARATLDQLVAIAGKLYAKDADLSDPNQAFKAWWPASSLWWRCIAFAAKLQPSPAEQIIEGIPDDEIKALERVAFANSLLDVESMHPMTMERHKNQLTDYRVEQ